MLEKNIQIYEFDEITSTNDFLLNQPISDKNELCIANKQINGRGQYGRVWLNQTKNALFSLKIILNNTRLEGLSLVVALSIVQILNTHYQQNDLQIKWPNDVYKSGQKLAGILIESRVNAKQLVVVIGVGINIDGSHNFANLKQNINIKQLILRISNQILKNIQIFTTSGLESFQILWQEYDYLTHNNKQIKYKNQVYQVLGIDKIGNLVINNNQDTIKISSSKQITVL
jgi:BirA family biotin operon repressor/biotin-[acetyl-CoA-carboxylase] ligase